MAPSVAGRPRQQPCHIMAIPLFAFAAISLISMAIIVTLAALEADLFAKIRSYLQSYPFKELMKQSWMRMGLAAPSSQLRWRG